MIETPASNLSARIHALIAHHHAGDPHAAAQQLGLEPDTLAGCSRVIGTNSHWLRSP